MELKYWENYIMYVFRFFLLFIRNFLFLPALSILTLMSCSGWAVERGIEASALDWPATVELHSKRAKCTGTVVGPRVILTAAMCVFDSGLPRVILNDEDRTEIEIIKCEKSPPRDRGGNIRKIALCVSKENIRIIEGAYENVNGDESLLRAGTKIQILGFGPTDYVSIPRFKLYPLSIGSTILQCAPFTEYTKGECVHDSLIEVFGSGFVTAIGKAVLSKGDGGGGAYIQKDDGTRILIGVHSRAIARKISTFAVTSLPSIVSWIEKWTPFGDGQSPKVCGIHENVKGCRKSTP